MEVECKKLRPCSVLAGRNSMHELCIRWRDRHTHSEQAGRRTTAETYRIVIQSRAPRGTRIVHKNMECLLPLTQLRDELFKLVKPLHVRGDGKALSGPKFVQLLRS